MTDGDGEMTSEQALADNPHTISSGRAAIGNYAAITIEAHPCDQDAFHGQLWEHHAEWSARVWQCPHEHTSEQVAFDCASAHLEHMEVAGLLEGGPGRRTACVLVDVDVPETAGDAEQFLHDVVAGYVGSGLDDARILGATVAED